MNQIPIILQGAGTVSHRMSIFRHDQRFFMLGLKFGDHAAITIPALPEVTDPRFCRIVLCLHNRLRKIKASQVFTAFINIFPRTRLITYGPDNDRCFILITHNHSFCSVKITRQPLGVFTQITLIARDITSV